MSHDEKGLAVVTGASSGIGAVYAERLARRGYDLLLVARNESRLAALADRLTNETGRSVGILVADLSDPAQITRVANRIEAEKKQFFTKVRNCYLERAKEEPNRFRIIDASKPLSFVKQELRDILDHTIAHHIPS